MLKSTRDCKVAPLPGKREKVAPVQGSGPGRGFKRFQSSPGTGSSSRHRVQAAYSFTLWPRSNFRISSLPVLGSLTRTTVMWRVGALTLLFSCW